MKYLFANSILVAFFILPTLFVQESEWELKKDEAGIKIFTREVEGTNIKEFKASTIINASSETLYNIILDVENYPKWIEDVGYAEKLHHIDGQIGMYYQLKLPWPIKDRDMAMVSNINLRDNNSILFDLEGKTSLKDEDKDFIRITEINGEWSINPIDKNKSEVTYRFLADPEGFLPAWVVNIFIVDGPFKTLQNLEEYSKVK
jgi:hypothetical protein